MITYLEYKDSIDIIRNLSNSVCLEMWLKMNIYSFHIYIVIYT